MITINLVFPRKRAKDFVTYLQNCEIACVFDQYLAAWIAQEKKVSGSSGPGPVAPPPMPKGWTFNVLARANYEMAHSNSAVTFMTFEEASRYGTAYTLQDNLVEAQRGAWLALSKLGTCFVGLVPSTGGLDLEDGAASSTPHASSWSRSRWSRTPRSSRSSPTPTPTL